MKPLSECYLYGFVDTAYLHARPPADIARALCEGGADLIQLRGKNSSQEQLLRMGTEIVKVTRPAGVNLVINDHIEVALELGAEFCHLGQEDFFDSGYEHLSQVRPPGSSLRIGLSTHAPAQALRAIQAGADYIAIGPVFATGTKPEAKPVTLDYVRWAADHVTVPWFAIGGINLHNLADVREAGARRVCVVSAILNQPDVSQAARAFKERLRQS